MKYFQIVFAALLLSGAVGCDEKMIMIPEFTAEDTGRRVLIEEITGVSCPNCPAGAATIEAFKETFPGRVVSVAYHSPPFLVSPLSGSEYDFARDEAQSIDQFIGESVGKPSAAVNRTTFDGQNRTWLGTIDSWAEFVRAELERPTLFGLEIENEYNEDTREVNITVTATPQQNAVGNYFISVMILESHIIDAQLDQTTEIEDYEHNHVFHKLITQSISGDPFATNLTADSDIVKTYSYTIPVNTEEFDVPWVAENCEIVAFITNGQGQVEQAAEAKVIEE